jgi:hypothetical protein
MLEVLKHSPPFPLDDDPSRKVWKMSILQELVYSRDYVVVSICETWLNDSVMSAEILTGYNIYRKDRLGRTGWGVLIAVTSGIRSSHRKDLERDNIEFAVVELVKDSTKSVILYTVYLPEPPKMNYTNLIYLCKGTLNQLVLS